MNKVRVWGEAMGGLFSLKKVKKARRRQVRGMLIGLLASAIVLISLWRPGQEDWLSRGPLTPGHEQLSCNSCHQEAEGSLRQQLQAKVRFGLGFRHSDADLGLKAVDNASCLSCHNRPDDHHPVFRFTEARFAESRQLLDASQCVSCHSEHTGSLASLPATSYCLNCHQDLKLKEDPLEIPHAKLVSQGMGASCMQCHDYHGNHLMEVATSLKDTLPVQAIADYLQKGTKVYSEEKKYTAPTHASK